MGRMEFLGRVFATTTVMAVIMILIYESYESRVLEASAPISAPTVASVALSSEAQRKTCRCPSTWKHFSGKRLTAQNFQNGMEQQDPRYNMSGRDSLVCHHPNLLLPPTDSSSKRCSLMPQVLQIDWTNKHWQWLRKRERGQDLLLYSAAYDNRTKTEPKGGVVRILVMAPKEFTDLPHCLLWSNGRLEPESSPVVRAEYMDYHSPKLRPYLLTCPTVPGDPPVGVSLVWEPCAPAANFLKVNGAHTNRTGRPEYKRPGYLGGLPEVAACGPALFYYQKDVSSRIIEWLEILKAVGVSKVFLYVSDVHPNIEKVLKQYEKEGFVSITDFFYPPPFVNEPLLRNHWTEHSHTEKLALEKIYFSDCLLRNMHRFRFMVHFDPDEVPVLLRHPSLPHLVNDIVKEYPEIASFGLRWLFFPMGIEDEASSADFYNVFSNSTQTVTAPKSGRKSPLSFFNKTKAFFTVLLNDRGLFNDQIGYHNNVKSIFDTRDITTVLSHKEFICAAGRCQNAGKRIPTSVARTGHFRSQCQAQECNDLEVTKVVQPIRDLRPIVVPKVLDALTRLNLLPVR